MKNKEEGKLREGFEAWPAAVLFLFVCATLSFVRESSSLATVSRARLGWARKSSVIIIIINNNNKQAKL